MRWIQSLINGTAEGKLPREGQEREAATQTSRRRALRRGHAAEVDWRDFELD